jgi:hypothetical protein
MRQISIYELVPNPTIADEPQHIIVDGDYTEAFHGAFWKDASGTEFPYYTYNLTTNLPPYGTELIPATTFMVKQNSGFGGNYTTYTKQTSDGSYNSAVYDAATNRTKIYVSNLMPQGTSVNTGVIVGISTYKFNIVGGTPKYVDERSLDESMPIGLVGRFSEVWGEIVQQNLLTLAQNFAGPIAPVNPVLGQTWFDSASSQLKIYDGSQWVAITSSIASYTHTQTTSAAAWIVDHNFNLPSPFIADVNVYVNTANGVKIMIPSDITFVSANRISISFNSSYSGYVIVKK